MEAATLGGRAVPPVVALGPRDGEKVGVNVVKDAGRGVEAKKVEWGPGYGVPCVCEGGFCIEYRNRFLHKMM